MSAFILYRSRSLLSRDMETVLSIQKDAERFNMSVGVTGFLYCHAQGFLQYIEGEAGPLCVCYARVTAASRHWGIEVLQTGEMRERRFPSWYMGLSDPADGRFSAPHGVEDLFEAPPEAIISAMETLAQEKEQRAGASLLRFAGTNSRLRRLSA